MTRFTLRSLNVTHWLLLLWASCCPLAANAAEPHLAIEPAVIQMSPTIDETNFSFEVTGTNISDRTIDIVRYKGGCGCISFASATTSLAPGETMNVAVIFDFKDFIGQQKRTLSIMTAAADSPEPVQNSFQLVGDIPTALQFSRKAAIWLYGEKVTTKEISVAVKPDYIISDLRIEDVQLNHFINVEQSLSEDGRHLSVRVTPTTTSLDEVSPTEKANLQIPYVVKYTTQNGTVRYERFWVLLAKRPELKENPTPTMDAPIQEGEKP